MNIAKKVVLGLLGILIAGILLFAYVLQIVNASDITNAQYYGTVTITNNSTANTTGCSVNMTPISDTLINNFGVTTAFDRVAIRNSYGEDAKFMPGYGTNPWIFWVPTIGENAAINNVIYTGNASLESMKYIFPATGMSIADSASLVLGGNFTISMTAYFNTGVSGNICAKSSEVEITSGSGNITAKFYKTGPVLITTLNTTISSAEYHLYIYTDSGNVTMEIDGVIKSTATLDGNNIADYGVAWDIGDTTPYIHSVNITAGGVTKCSIDWEYAETTLSDDSGYNNDATVNWRTTSSDADVSAELISFLPISQAISSISGNASWPSMVTAVPDEPDTAYSTNTSPGLFFAGPFNWALDSASISRSFFWHNFAFFIIIAAGILAFRIHPSLVVKSITMGAIMVLFAIEGVNIYGMFTVIYFGLYCTGLIILSRSYGW